MSCKTVSDRHLPRRLDRRAGRTGASRSAWNSLGGLALVLAQVGCMADGSAGETPEVQEAKVNALVSGTLHMEHCTTADQEALKDFAVYASESLNLGTGVRISGGRVGVRDPNDPSDQLGYQLKVGRRAVIDPTQRTFAKDTQLRTESQVGDLQTDIADLDRQGSAQHGALSAFPSSTPIPPQVTAVMVPDVASADITIPQNNSSIPAYDEGEYRNVEVRAGGLLQLSGGDYTFRSLTVRGNARVLANAATTITVNELIFIGANARVAPASGFTAADLVIRSAAGPQGTDSNGEIPAVNLGANSITRALIVAPGGYVRFGNQARLRGALIARSVLWEQGNPDTAQLASVIYEDGIAGEACQPYDCSNIDDGNDCTHDTCTPENGQKHDPKPDGTVCDGDGEPGACMAYTNPMDELTSKCESLCNEESQTVKGNPRLDGVTLADDFATPPGKYVVRYVSGCMKYNPLWWWSVNGSEDGKWAWVMIADDDRYIMPGTFGFFNSATPPAGINSGFKEFADCVAANLEQATPLVFDHTAVNSQLGIRIRDRPLDDNRHGLLGQNPIWSITPFECSDAGGT
jgi:hypothetical protein